MAREYPFGTGAILLSLAGVIGLGLRLRHFEFTEAGYIMAVGQVSVLGLIILISGFIVDLQQELLRRGGREIRICTLILIAAGVGLMIVSIYQVQYFEMLVEEMLSLILQILIFATMWFQLVILNDVRLLYREVGQRTAVKSTS